MSETAFSYKLVLRKGDHAGNALAFLRHHPTYRHLCWDECWGLSLPVQVYDGRWLLGPGLVVGEPDDSLLAFLSGAKRRGRSDRELPFDPTPADVRRCVWALESIVRTRSEWGIAA